MGFVGGFTWTTGPHTSPDRFRRHRVRAAARRRRCPPRWPEAGRGTTPRGRRRAASARRPSRARARGRDRPRRPDRGRARVAACRASARLARIRRCAPATSRRTARRTPARIRRSWCPPSIPWPRSDRVTDACHVIVAPPVELEQIPVQGAHRRLRSGSLRMDGNRLERMVSLAGSDLEVPDERRSCVLPWPARQSRPPGASTTACLSIR